MIEKSAAFKDGGLIDITFDEGNPPFTYTGNSFNNANAYGPTSADKPERRRPASRPTRPARTSTASNVHTEPTGPNSTLGDRRQRQPAVPGPGRQRLHRPAAGLHADRPTLVPANCVPGIVSGRRGSRPAPHRHGGGRPSSTYVLDTVDRRRRHRPPGDRHRRHDRPGGTSPIPAEHLRRDGQRHRPAVRPTSPTGSVIDGSFQLVDQAGNPVTPTGAVTQLTLSAEGAPGYLHPGQTADPLYDAHGPDPRRRRHRQRADQPADQARHDQQRRSTTTTAGCARWRTSSGSATATTTPGCRPAPSPAASTARATSASRPSPGSAPFGPDVFNNARHRR